MTRTTTVARRHARANASALVLGVGLVLMGAVLIGLSGTERAGAVVPGLNGRIAFARTVPGTHGEIFVMNPDGSGLRQLTHVPPKSNAAFATYSPDGTKIVLLGPRDDRYTMDANGTHLTRIVADQPGGVSDWGTSP